MQVSCSIVDWAEVERRKAASTLEDDFTGVEGDEDWIREADDWGDSAAQFFAAGTIYRALAPHLSAENRVHGDASLGFVFGEKIVDDLNAAMECWFSTLNPDRVSRIASEFEQFDFDELAKLYDQYCPVDEREYASNFEEFKEYVDQWQAAFSEAAMEGRGILCHCG